MISLLAGRRAARVREIARLAAELSVNRELLDIPLPPFNSEAALDDQENWPYLLEYRGLDGVMTTTGCGSLNNAATLAKELHGTARGDVTLIHTASEVRFCVAGEGFKRLQPVIVPTGVDPRSFETAA